MPVLVRQQPGARGQLKGSLPIVLGQCSYEPPLPCQGLDPGDAVHPLARLDLGQGPLALLQQQQHGKAVA